VPSGWLGLDN